MTAARPALSLPLGGRILRELCLLFFFFILCLVPGKEITLLMQTLNTLSTPEEKLAALCKKYAELVSPCVCVPGSGAEGGVLQRAPGLCGEADDGCRLFCSWC